MFLPLRDDNPTSRLPFVTVALIAAGLVLVFWFLLQVLNVGPPPDSSPS